MEKGNIHIEKSGIPEEPKYDFSITFHDFKIIEQTPYNAILQTKICFQKLNEDIETGSDFFMGIKFDGYTMEIQFLRKQEDTNYRLLCGENVYFTKERIKDGFSKFGNISKEWSWDYMKQTEIIYRLREKLRDKEIKGCFDETTKIWLGN